MQCVTGAGEKAMALSGPGWWGWMASRPHPHRLGFDALNQLRQPLEVGRQKSRVPLVRAHYQAGVFVVTASGPGSRQTLTAVSAFALCNSRACREDDLSSPRDVSSFAPKAPCSPHLSASHSHSLSACMPDTELRNGTSPHFTLTGYLWYGCYHPHFVNEETMV